MSGVHSDAQESAVIPTCDGPKTVADVLAVAADLIEGPGAWTQGYFATNKYGVAVMGTVPEAVCWCAVGAIQRAAGATVTLTTIAARRAVEGVVGADVAGWNDTPGRTQAEVVSALRTAAEKARTAAQSGSVGTSGASEP